LPTALCRLPRGFAVGKAFADWVYAFADRGKQSAKRRFPVVYIACRFRFCFHLETLHGEESWAGKAAWESRRPGEFIHLFLS
jgi:hypothetical protein